jgi:transcriptional regulator
MSENHAALNSAAASAFGVWLSCLMLDKLDIAYQYRNSISKDRQFMARNRKTDLLRGTLDLLILRVLELQALHGIAIADRIRQVTGGTFDVPAGSLFPALHRLEQEGWIAGEWSTTEDGRRIKSYSLTTAGKKQLAAEKRQWDRIVKAVGQVLEMS